MGFSNRDMNIIANVVLYHSGLTPSPYDEGYKILSNNDKMIVSKLAAILKLAESMDIAHKQKFSKVEILTSGDELVFKLTATQDILLEEWNFESSANFFQSVMGCKPVIKIKIKNGVI